MRIDGTKVGPVGESKKEAPKPVSPIATVPGGAVVVSERLNRLASGTMDETRLARLAEIAQMMDRGDYQVDYQKLAERLVDEELARWGKP